MPVVFLMEKTTISTEVRLGPDGSYFLVEMEQGEREIYVKVTAEGEILP